MIFQSPANKPGSLSPYRPVPAARLALMTAVLAACLATIARAQSETTNLKSWIGLDLFSLMGRMDNMGKMCLVILALFSLLSWAVIIYKFLHIRQATRQTNGFIKLCNESQGTLQEAFHFTDDFPDSPLAQLLRQGYTELEAEHWYREGYDVTPEARVELVKIGTERIFERTITSELTHLESKLIFLATTSHVCPFIGLFGTVWGIMGSFQSIALSGGQTSLSSLAPGVSTALLTTVGGLFCSIPASVMFNYLTHNVRLLTARMDEFALELSNVIQKQAMRESGGYKTGMQRAVR